MAAVKHGPIVIRRRLGAMLKRLRGGLGLRLEEVARQLEISPSKLSRLETGQVAPRIRDVRDLLGIYDAPGDVRDRVMRWAEEAKEPGWWQPLGATFPYDLDLYISLEAESRKIQIFSVPICGLLQTEAYAREALAASVPYCSATEIERLVEIRLGRQTVIDPQRSEAPAVQLHAVLDEAALRRGSDSAVMREQLEELVARSHRPNVHLQVLPFEAGFTRANGTFAIFEPRDSGDQVVVNVEGSGHDGYLEAPGVVANYEAIWTDVLHRCLDVEQSRDFIARLASERE